MFKLAQNKILSLIIGIFLIQVILIAGFSSQYNNNLRNLKEISNNLDDSLGVPSSAGDPQWLPTRKMGSFNDNLYWIIILVR